MRTISSTIDLDATPQQVWSALTDTSGYPDWNPFITRLDGTLQTGNKIQVRIAPPGARAMTFRPTVTDVTPGRRLAWLGHLLVPGLFDGAHSFTLEPLAGGGTRFVQSETFSGVFVAFSRGLLKNTTAGFDAMNNALRERVAQRESR